jgi:hypothetical protein
MAPQDIVADRSFGPQYLDKFDFTLHFQELIFGFIPAIVAILWSPFAIWWLSKDAQDILVTILFWGKAVRSPPSNKRVETFASFNRLL